MTLRADRRTTGRSVIPLPFLIVALAALLVVIVRNAWVGEDAYITFRTVDNFVHGYGLRWNVDERVQTYTHPLWFFIVALFYSLTREPYFTSLALSIALSLGTVLIVVRRIATDAAAASLVLTAAVFSKAFVDYATSGLENPLTFFLLAVFFAVYFTVPAGERRVRWLALTAALLAVNRQDAIVLVLPPLVVALWQARGRRTLRAVAVGALPIVLWEAFSIVYYGFPFPNTAYAKLQTGIRAADLVKQGFEYLLDSLITDPLTLTAIAGVSVVAIASRRRSLWPLVAGVALHLVLLVRAGGDFMSGRLLSAPFVCALTAAARFDGLFDDVTMGAGVAVLALVGMMAPMPTVLSSATPPGGWIEPSGITDERRFQYQWTGLLRLPHDGAWPDTSTQLVDEARARAERSVILKNVGRVGFGAGPSLHIIDSLALTDPLLARLPARGDWRVGHYERDLPDGYQATIEHGINHIQDPGVAALYDDLWRVTAGPIWARARWRAILRLNLGFPARGPADGSPLPAILADFRVTPEPCTISGATASVDCVVDAAPSDARTSIVSYLWSYPGGTVTNNMRTNLHLTCSNTGGAAMGTVPVTLTVTDTAGRSDSRTRNVPVVKLDACGAVHK